MFAIQQQKRSAVCYRVRDLPYSGRRATGAQKFQNGTTSDTEKVFEYMLKQRVALNKYCRNGLGEIDNTLCESAHSVVTLVRCNFMFFGSDSGGERAAVMYSLIGSCKLNGIEPETWLRHIISVASQQCERAVTLELISL